MEASKRKASDDDDRWEAPLQALFHYYSSHDSLPASRRSEKKLQKIQKKCNSLYNGDYECYMLPNTDPVLCDTYPLQIIIPENLKGDEEKANNGALLYEEFKQTCFARARYRFACPFLIYKGKNLCRSAGLAETLEMAVKMLSLFSKSMTEHRRKDAEVLQLMGVKYLWDLMLDEHMIMFGVVPTATSESTLKDIYDELVICSVPFPGNEFFREWCVNNLSGQKQVYHWECGIFFNIPPPYDKELPPLGWDTMKEWDIITLTQNYLRLFLNFLIKEEETPSGILIHCVSGWDRTPMWICLIRLTLWADGLAHDSLSAQEMLFLTVAYDWMLFGHRLKHRMKEGSTVLLWVFHFLQNIQSEEYSIHYMQSQSTHKESSEPDEELALKLVKRKERLFTIQQLFESTYNSAILPIFKKKLVKVKQHLLQKKEKSNT